MNRRLLALLFLPVAAVLCQAAERQPWVNARLVGSPEPPAPYAVVRAFPNLETKRPVAIELEPGTGQLLLLQYPLGDIKLCRLRRFAPQAEVAEAETLIELPDTANSIGFHPRYPENGWIYIGSTAPDPADAAGKKRVCHIVRYTVDRQPPHRVVEGSALKIVEWPSNGHNGMATAFGNDGMLYVTTGDGTPGFDADYAAQDLSSPCGKVLRLDVDGAPAGRPYRVPADNPFLGTEGARPEIWAYGLRNPWRITADRESGQIWVGQNGQDLRESAHLLYRGANYGWSAYEGSRVYLADRLRGPSPFTPPTIEHDHGEFRSLTGGFVYRGARFPELAGAYLYGDWATGRIWAAKHDGTRLLWDRELVDTALAITGFGTTPEGDILVVDHGGDGLYRLEPAPPAAAGARPFPTRLSETGLFANVPALQPAPGVQPYAINAPAWHDGATADRLLALPGTSTVKAGGGWATWDLSDGAVLAQTLSLPPREGRPGRRLETRVLLKQAGDWSAYSYLWNDAQDEAELVGREGRRLKFADREWLVPSRSDCLMCHSRAAKFAIGLTGAQLHRDVEIGGRMQNQIASFIDLGLATGPLPKPDAPRHVDPYDPGAPLADRARTYLAVNCAHCHVSEGGGNTLMNLAPGAAPDKQHLIDAPPEHGAFGLPDARIVAPGNPGRSILTVRVAMRGPGQMPPVGTLMPDPAGIQMLLEWLQGLPAPAPQP
ncbi:MAG TPA: PQQ-dependent sugar dehydrogenase [Chthoniobacteraceae bacterium]|nr:PQQ-dependent sugar dehydrogenase [Chthoniobacteraceae bacterium]